MRVVELPAIRSIDGVPVSAKRILKPGQVSFKRHDNNTEQMNVNGESSGTALVVWNGTGVGDTGGDWSVSGVGSETSGSMYSGTNGWDTGVTSSGNNTTLDNGSMIDVDGTYDELKFWLQPKAYPAGSRLRVVWLDSSNTAIGRSILVSNYTEDMDLDTWQQIAIPISDFNLTGNVQKLRFMYMNASGQQYYLDDIDLVHSGGGGPYRFQVEAPDANTRYHLSMLVLMIAGPGSSWSPSTFANISALSKGLLLRQRRKSDGEILWKRNSKDNLALFGRYHPQDDITYSDGTLQLGFMMKPGRADVLITYDEILEFVVRDDLSSITEARAYAEFGIEEASS